MMFSLVLVKGLWPRWCATPGWGCASPLVLRAPDGRQLWTSRDAGLRGGSVFPDSRGSSFFVFFSTTFRCVITSKRLPTARNGHSMTTLKNVPPHPEESYYETVYRRFVKNSMPQSRANNFSCSSYSSSWGLWPLWYRVPPPRGVVLSATPEWGVALPWFGVVVNRPGVGRKSATCPPSGRALVTSRLRMLRRLSTHNMALWVHTMASGFVWSRGRIP